MKSGKMFTLLIYGSRGVNEKKKNKNDLLQRLVKDNRILLEYLELPVTYLYGIR